MNKNTSHHPSHASADSSEAVAELAYRYYLQEGRPEGRAEEHWFRAEAALSGEPQPGTTDVNGVPKAELARFVAEGGPGVPSASPGNTVGILSATREQIREQTSAAPHAPRQSLRPREKSRQSR